MPSGDRELHDLLLRRAVGVGDLAGHAAFVHDEDAVGHAEDFGHLKPKYATSKKFVISIKRN